MAEHVALLRDNGSPLILEGATTITEDHPGEVTTHPVPDRSFSTDGRTRRPIMISIEALVSPNPTLQGLTTGPARLQEVRAWLLRAADGAEVLDVQQPDRALAVGFVVKSHKTVRGKMDAEQLSVVLQELRIARSETVELTAVRQTTPVDAATAGLAEETDKGTTTVERSQSFLDALLFGGGAGG